MFITGIAIGQQPSVSVHAPGQVVQGRNFTVTIRVQNANAQVNNGPELKGCTLRFGPAVSTMESHEYVNGRASSTYIRDYSFTYYAEKAGSVTIPSISVNADGKTLKTQPRTLTILPPDKADRQAQQNAGAPAGGGTVRSNAGRARANDLIVTVTMSKNHIYEQEAIIATIKVYTKHNISSFRATTLPSFDGFLSEELDVREEPKIEHFRGDNYYSVVLKRCLLYPQKSGTLTVNSGRYDVTLETYEEISNGFFITRRPVQQNITTSSNKVSVVVSPLPSPQPANFSGAVGSFKASVNLEPSLLRTNDAATYTYTVTGTGNIKYLKAPDMDFGPNVEEYEPETESDAHFNGKDMTGTFTAKYTIVPQQVGQLKIPAEEFVYFNPQSKKYVTVSLPGFDKKVIKGSDSAQSAVVQQKTGDKTLDDILYIKPLKSSDLEKDASRTFHSWYYILCYIIIFAGLIFAIIVYRRYVKINSNATLRRTARANKVAGKRLRQAREYMQAHKNDEFYASLASALWGYISDKLGIPASALTRENISERLLETGAPAPLVEKTIDVLDQCEMARFTPQHSDDEIAGLYRNSVDVINGLEAVKSKVNK